MKVVYIIGAFRASTAWQVEQNVREAELLIPEVAAAGAMPICPQANTRYSHGLLTEQFWLDGTRELCRRSDAGILVSNWESSDGSRGEVEEMTRLRKPVFETVNELREWLSIPSFTTAEYARRWLWGYVYGSAVEETFQ